MAAAPKTFPIEVLVLGSFELKIHGQIVDPPPKAIQSLLVLLLTRKTTPVDRNSLATTLWPHSSPERASFYLRRSVSQLRNLLGAERCRLQSDLSFDLSGCRCDLLDFQAKLNYQPEAAVRLYRGRISIGRNNQEVEALAERIHDQFVNAALEVASNLADRGTTSEAMLWLKTLLATDGTCERASEELMRLLAEVGDFVGISRTYRQLRKRLDSELGLTPSPATTELYHQLMNSAPIAPPERSHSKSLTPPCRLSIPLTPLIGRMQERESLAIEVAKHRLVAIIGFGGVGKTRLAMDFVERSERAFAVSCAKWQSESDAVAAVAGAILVDELTGEKIDQAIGAGDFVLLLDNVEECLQLAGDIATFLLTTVPSMRIVVTSRRRVDWDGVRSFLLRPLAVPSASDNVSNLLTSDAAALFVQRASAANPNFSLTSRNAPAISSICRQLDGLPLAIELAALRVRSYSVPEIERRLSDRFALLTGHSSKTTLEAVMKWTLSVLSEQEQELLTELSVFPASWDREAVAAVCGAYSEDALNGLVDAGLLMQEDGRFSRLETVRQFALKLKRPHEAQFLRYAEHFNAAAQSHVPKPGKSDSDSSLQWFYREKQNIVEILGLPSRMDSQNLRRLAIEVHNSTYWLWHEAGRVAEFYELTKTLVAVDDCDSVDQIQAHFVRGGAAHLLARLDEAERHFEYGEKMASRLGIPTWQGEALICRAEVYSNQGRLSEARQVLAEAIALFENTADELRMARCLRTLGFVEREKGDGEASLKSTTRALQIYIKRGEVSERLWCIGSLGAQHLEMGHPELAAKHFREAIAGCRPESDTYVRIWNLTMLGQACLSAGQHEEAAAHVREAIQLRGGNDDDCSLEWPSSLLGAILIELKDYKGAQCTLEQAWRLHQSSGPSKLGAETLLRLTDLHLRQEHWSTAAAYFELAKERIADSEVCKLATFLEKVSSSLRENAPPWLQASSAINAGQQSTARH
jgi:predicted ATPase/DNA-binding SARP family transcriptional activator/Flp pilus assembly protein TadD